MRKTEIIRNTNETKIKLLLDLDGKGIGNIDTGCGFLDHMLTLFAKHSGFDLQISCKGDTNVDFHHTTEDVGIALGQAIKSSLGDMRGINRYADTILPMDEALILSALEIGRAHV